MKIYFLAEMSKGFIPSLIRFWQFGFPYTHIAIIYKIDENGNIYITEMQPEGLKNTIYNRKNPYSIYYVKVNEQQYNKFFDELYDIIKSKPKYDFKGILGFPLRNKHIQDKSKFFCSELAFYLCLKAGIVLLKDTKPCEVSPRLFLKSPLLKKLKKGENYEELYR